MSDHLNDADRIEGRLYTAVLSDVMDGLGLMNQAMHPRLRPLDETKMMFGRARTGIYMNRYSVEPHENPYETEIAFVDDLHPGDVAVLACGGVTDRIAPWGELLSTASRARGATGCVTDGLVRDIKRIRELEFPVFHGGIGPLDSRGRAKMMVRDVAVEIGGVRLVPGDYVMGDADGIVVVPQARAEEVFASAFGKVDAEDETRAMLEEGKTLASVFEKFGVL